jgi:hypothetical protein
MSADTIARLKITLDDVEPAVLRRVVVPFDIRLDRLHLTTSKPPWLGPTAIFTNGAPVMSAGALPIPIPNRTGDFLDARKSRLSGVLADIGTKTLKYLYDFGDGWEHTITMPSMPCSPPSDTTSVSCSDG